MKWNRKLLKLRKEKSQEPEKERSEREAVNYRERLPWDLALGPSLKALFRWSVRAMPFICSKYTSMAFNKFTEL